MIKTNKMDRYFSKLNSNDLLNENKERYLFTDFFLEQMNLMADIKNDFKNLNTKIGGIKPEKKKLEYKKINSLEMSIVKDIGEIIVQILKNEPIERQFDHDITYTIKQVARKKGHDLRDSDIVAINSYIRKRIPFNSERLIIDTHPIFYKNDSIKSIVDSVIDQDTPITHDEYVGQAQIQSFYFKDFLESGKDSLITLRKRKYINPLLFALMAIKLPGFEDLMMLDYYTFLQHINENKIDEEFQKMYSALLIFRISDPNELETNDKKYIGKNNEILRALISTLFKYNAFNVRNMNLSYADDETDYSHKLIKILDSIDTGAPTIEMNRINALFQTISFKPILMKSKECSGIKIRASVSIELKMTRGTNQIRTETLKSVTYDKGTGCVVIRNNDSQIVPLKMDDMSSMIGPNGTFVREIYNMMEPHVIYHANGVIILSIPRYDRRTSLFPKYIRKNKSDNYNKSYVDFAQNIEIGDKEYQLSVGVGRDVPNLNCTNPCLILKNYVFGEFALVKCGNYWLDYNTSEFFMSDKKRERINEVANYQWLKEKKNGTNGDMTFEDYKKSDKFKELEKSILEMKFKPENFIIREQTALNKLCTLATVVIYKVDYDLYSQCLENKTF